MRIDETYFGNGARDLQRFGLVKLTGSTVVGMRRNAY
jgi:hypothetical protein